MEPQVIVATLVCCLLAVHGLELRILVSLFVSVRFPVMYCPTWLVGDDFYHWVGCVCVCGVGEREGKKHLRAFNDFLL